MTIPSPTNNAQLFAIVRAAVVIVAIVAIVLGVLALFLPGVTVTTVGVLFGIFLAISGIQRIARSIALRRVMDGWFLVGLIVGLLVLVAGILSITHPVSGVTFIAFMIGIAWILGGATDIVASVGPQVNGFGIVGGVILMLAGFAFLFAPNFAISAFLVFSAILLIVVGVGILLTFPRTMLGTVAAAE